MRKGSLQRRNISRNSRVQWEPNTSLKYPHKNNNKENKSTFWKLGQTCWVRWHNHKSFLPQTTSAKSKTKALFSYKFMEMSKCAFSLGRHCLRLGRIINRHCLYNQYELPNNFWTGKSCNSSGIVFLCYNLWDNRYCWMKLASENLLEAVQFL